MKQKWMCCPAALSWEGESNQSQGRFHALTDASPPADKIMLRHAWAQDMRMEMERGNGGRAISSRLMPVMPS